MNIETYINQRRQRVEEVLARELKPRDESQTLHAAMAYAVFNGGKRLRPVLAYASAETLGEHFSCADTAACALELIHSYSLVHDDLPAMDDDNLRRGVPTCHIEFDEATAILAGDALQALAFELLAESPALGVEHAVRLRMIALLGRASGWQGMVLGQSIDINAEGGSLDESALAHMHSLKTGALITASVQLGALSTGKARPEDMERLEAYARAAGLAFQIQDDILDVESDTATLGKQQGKDQALHKPTYPAILGMDGARRKAQALCDQAIATLDDFGAQAQPLIELARYIIARRH